MKEALDIRVTGVVQGVGFRPFVYRAARRNLVSGWVLNAVDGVDIHAEGEAHLLDAFVIELSENAPAASQVREIDMKEVPLQGCEGFEIRFSDAAAQEKTTLVSPDLATCDDCVRELFDPADRRFRYPFINCTNCGPRFTIIDNLPYDRPATSMKGFDMCPVCAAEYEDPTDRRFHAQPDACFDCGPRVSFAEKIAGAKGEDLEVTWGSTREESDAIFARAAQMLAEGKILAVKGLGGFHLVCDAANEHAVAELRARKRRQGKAFAVIVASADDARRACEVDDAEQRLLESPQRPIVLLRKREGVILAPGVADALPELGVMLPCTPVQHLLLHDFAQAIAKRRTDEGETWRVLPPMLVMTSGNIHDEPIVTDDADAYERLAGVADAFLGNDRPILARYDDSVVRIIKAGTVGDAVQTIRRARSYAPMPLKVPTACRPSERADAAASRGTGSCGDPAGSRTEVRFARAIPTSSGTTETLADSTNETGDENLLPALLAVGPEQKNTFAFVRGVDDQSSEAFVSQHIGDLEDASVFDAWLDAKARFGTLFKLKPALLACDMHPEYLSSKWAHAESQKRGIPLVEVQHHHAHIASVLGENNLTDAVCGIAFDGTGYGVDGAIWGGEVLLANQRAFERFANFAYVPMPGGAAAVKNPLRMAYGVLWAFDLLEHPGAANALAQLGDEACQICDRMIERGLNAPYTSSVGRLFDAASALLGICTQPTYEGEPAILLEAAMGSPTDSTNGTEVGSASDDESSNPYRIDIVKNEATAESTAQDTSVLLLDAEPLFRALLDDVAAGVPAPTIARKFHDAFVEAIVNVAELSRALYGLGTVALSGGVFMNRYLVEHALAALERAGFTVAINRELPPNDGCVSYGQAVVACAAKHEQA